MVVRIVPLFILYPSTGHVLVTLSTGHVIRILLEDSIDPMISDRSKKKALKLKSHDRSGFLVGREGHDGRVT